MTQFMHIRNLLHIIGILFRPLTYDEAKRLIKSKAKII